MTPLENLSANPSVEALVGSGMHAPGGHIFRVDLSLPLFQANVTRLAAGVISHQPDLEGANHMVAPEFRMLVYVAAIVSTVGRENASGFLLRRGLAHRVCTRYRWQKSWQDR